MAIKNYTTYGSHNAEGVRLERYRAEEIVKKIDKFRHVLGSDWLEYIFNVEYNYEARPKFR